MFSHLVQQQTTPWGKKRFPESRAPLGLDSGVGLTWLQDLQQRGSWQNRWKCVHRFPGLQLVIFKCLGCLETKEHMDISYHTLSQPQTPVVAFLTMHTIWSSTTWDYIWPRHCSRVSSVFLNYNCSLISYFLEQLSLKQHKSCSYDILTYGVKKLNICSNADFPHRRRPFLHQRHHWIQGLQEE